MLHHQSSTGSIYIYIYTYAKTRSGESCAFCYSILLPTWGSLLFLLLYNLPDSKLDGLAHSCQSTHTKIGSPNTHFSENCVHLKCFCLDYTFCLPPAPVCVCVRMGVWVSCSCSSLLLLLICCGKIKKGYPLEFLEDNGNTLLNCKTGVSPPVECQKWGALTNIHIYINIKTNKRHYS